MAELSDDLLMGLPANVDDLLTLCRTLITERESLNARLSAEGLKVANANLQISALNEKIAAMQSVQFGAMTLDAAKQNRARLLKLVREIDKCIALLNK